ncbi:MAG TPA: hypothetical protein PLT33_08530, partial [Deltaproteobacteria bacterium]|nr:hypothetical protein [Deltaproteobacteria bacterium]
MKTERWRIATDIALWYDNKMKWSLNHRLWWMHHNVAIPRGKMIEPGRVVIRLAPRMPGSVL